MDAPAGFVQVAVARGQSQADLVKAVLEASAVQVYVLKGEAPAAGLGEGAVTMGLYVPAAQAERARQLLAAGEGNAD